eukprot:SAG31_NODE_3609_length_4070_cov_2.814153_4_plen_61_part_00
MSIVEAVPVSVRARTKFTPVVSEATGTKFSTGILNLVKANFKFSMYLGTAVIHVSIVISY